MMRDRLLYFLRNGDWKFGLACLAVLVMIAAAWRLY
jgi:hypothetical protein